MRPPEQTSLGTLPPPTTGGGRNIQSQAIGSSLDSALLYLYPHDVCWVSASSLERTRANACKNREASTCNSTRLPVTVATNTPTTTRQSRVPRSCIGNIARTYFGSSERCCDRSRIDRYTYCRSIGPPLCSDSGLRGPWGDHWIFPRTDIWQLTKPSRDTATTSKTGTAPKAVRKPKQVEVMVLTDCHNAPPEEDWPNRRHGPGGGGPGYR